MDADSLFLGGDLLLGNSHTTLNLQRPLKKKQYLSENYLNYKGQNLKMSFFPLPVVLALVL